MQPSVTRHAFVQKDLHELRRIASIRGLISPALRKAVWPLFLGIGPVDSSALPSLLPATDPTGRAARDTQTIANDVARCLHESQVDVGEQDRGVLRESLVRLLKAVVDGENVYYYQARRAARHASHSWPRALRFLMPCTSRAVWGSALGVTMSCI